MSIFDLLTAKSFQSEYVEHLKAVETGDEMLIAMGKYIASREFEDDCLSLKNGTYSFPAPEKRRLFFGREEKTRNIWCFSERETNFQRLIAYALHEYDGRFSACVQSGLYKHVHWETTLRRVKEYGGLCYFTTDIHKCSDSIDREILLNKLEGFIDDDPILLKFLRDFVQSREYSENDVLRHDRCAVPAGSPLSWFLVNLYLNELDKCIEPRADFYARLTDRIVIGCFDPEKLKMLGKTVSEVLRRLKLDLNKDETFFLTPGESFDFQGKRVAGKDIDFSAENLKRIKKILRKKANFAKKKLKGMNPDKRALLCIYTFETSAVYNYLKKSFSTVTTDRSYKELDRYIQGLLREIITEKSGNGKYSCTYKDLQRYGYCSLTGQYYKFIEQGKRSNNKVK